MLIQVGNIIECEDGSAVVEIFYGDDFKEFLKKKYNRKRISKKLVQDVVIEGLKNYIKSEGK